MLHSGLLTTPSHHRRRDARNPYALFDVDSAMRALYVAERRWLGKLTISFAPPHFLKNPARP
jgi:hypothetical protein